MDANLVQLILDAGIGIVAICVIAFLFHKTMEAHKHERREWRESSDEQAEKVTQAISDLATSINNSERL